MIFLNISNYPSKGWSKDQRKAALEKCDKIVDFPFPRVPTDATTEEVHNLAGVILSSIPADVTHALVQGEFTLAYRLIQELDKLGVECYAAASERLTHKNAGKKSVWFKFIRFRRYS